MIIHFIYFKIVVGNPSNPQLFVVGKLVIIVIIVYSFTYLCSNEFFFGSKICIRCFVASVVNAT